ncbi:MAG: Maf family protein [Lachnospiraceae bacterium]
MKVILASGSPRRKELLEQIGVTFTIQKAEGEEVIHSTVPEEVVKELSQQKAEEVYQKVVDGTEDVLVLGADTVVASDGNILGKPRDEAHAFEMLKSLQGRTHHVYTGVTALVFCEGEKKQITFAEDTQVTMYPMTDEQIRAYIATGEPMDKAGAYAIQGKFAVYIKQICGDYNNVVGLPIARLYQSLLEKNILLGNQ